MTDAPLFSVVVPMYNVEAFLPECVESIRDQTLQNIEIILVDDGSPDRCGTIAKAYAKEDPRIRVVHRANGGLGPARNSGMEVARGEYIGFVDSDDWIEPDMYERLYTAAEASNADVVYTGMKTVSRGVVCSEREHPYAGVTLRGAEEIFPLRAAFYGASPARIVEDSTPVSVCLAGYKRSFIERNNLSFLNIRSEDIIFNIIVCRAAETVACISGAPYCYRRDEQPSITKTFNEKTVDSFFQLFRLLEQLVDEESAECWEECHLREQRCVLDYCRVLVGMIEGSSLDAFAKNSNVREVLNHPALHRACQGYPWWKLPTQQAIFYLLLNARSVGLARMLTRIKGVVGI